MTLAVRFAPAPTEDFPKEDQMHAMIVEAFLLHPDGDPIDWQSPVWTAAGVSAVMDKFRITGDGQHYPVLIVGAESIQDILSDSFKAAWSEWAAKRDQSSKTAITIRVIGDSSDDERIVLDPYGTGPITMIEIRFYVKSFFDFWRRPSHGMVSRFDPVQEMLREQPAFRLDFSCWVHDPFDDMPVALKTRFEEQDAVAIVDDLAALSKVTLVTVVGGQLDFDTVAVHHIDVEPDFEEM